MPNHIGEFHVGRRFASTTISGAIAMFGAWCAFDYWVDRVLPYPEHVGDFDVAFIVGVPAACLAFAIVRLKPFITLAFLSAVIATLLAIVLFAVFGISFHFAIGGEL